MRFRTAARDATDRAAPVFVLVMLLPLSPATHVWADGERPWWLIFAVWAAIVALTRWVR